MSACIITRNEQKKLPLCLSSLRWVPEVIVVDDYSSDDTPNICHSFKNVRFATHKFEGFGIQKNYALLLAANDWVLNVDADEIVTSELQIEIEDVLTGDTPFSGFFVRRKNLWFGRYYTDSMPGALRLFRKSTGRFNQGYVHESVILDGQCGQLNGLLLHKPFGDQEIEEIADDVQKLVQGGFLQSLPALVLDKLFHRGELDFLASAALQPLGEYLQLPHRVVDTPGAHVAFLD